MGKEDPGKGGLVLVFGSSVYGHPLGDEMVDDLSRAAGQLVLDSQKVSPEGQEFANVLFTA